LATEEAKKYIGLVDLIMTDRPWGCMKGKSGVGQQDELETPEQIKKLLAYW
jgi:hypothetical protein